MLPNHKDIRDDRIKALHELASLCEAGLVRQWLMRSAVSPSAVDVHHAVDAVLSSPERPKHPVQCAQTLAVFWEQYNAELSMQQRFEQDDIQSALEAGYPAK